MRILDRYVLREFIVSQLVALSVLVVMVIIVDLWERMDTYLDHNATAGEVLRFHVASIPYTIMIALPVSFLLGTIFGVGRLARRNELNAFRCAGISLPRLLEPLLVLGALFSFFSLGFNEYAVPLANRYRDYVYETEIRESPRHSATRRANLNYLGQGGRMFQIKEYDVPEKVMHEVTIVRFDGNRLVERLDARTGSWTGKEWIFRDGFRRTFPEDGPERAVPFDSLAVPGLPERPSDFEKDVDEPELMTYPELRRYIAKVRASGSNARRYEVDLASRLAIPFANFIVVLLGAPLAASASGGGAVRGFGLGLAVAFLYYGLLRLSQTLGNNTGLPPQIAPWIANAVFVVVGVFLVARMSRR
jgi:lipopolysaccharide export system permease protein